MLPYASLQPTLSLERAALKRLTTWLCIGWGLHCHSPHEECGELLPRHFTLTASPPCPLSMNGEGVRKDEAAEYFLLHFPSPHGARVLPGILPFDVRTFLTPRKRGRAAARFPLLNTIIFFYKIYIPVYHS